MNSTDAKQFHDDLKAAIILQVPIEIGEETDALGSELTMARLCELESAILPRFSRETSSVVDADHANNKSILDQIIVSEPGLPNRYRAALHTFDQTSSMRPVLDGLSVRKIAGRQVSRAMRRAFTYLVFLLSVAFCGLFVFKSRIVRFVDDLRSENALTTGFTVPERFDETVWLTMIVAVIGVGLILLVIWMLFGGATKVAMWLGGRHYVRCRTSTSAIRTLQLLMGTGLPADDALSISCDLTGADKNVRRDMQTALQDPQNVLELSSWAHYLMISANQRLAYMKVAAPTALICSVGGLVALIYCVAIFWPIITVLRDLARVGI